MTAVYCIVECFITYNDGKTETRRPTYKEIAAGFASVDKISVINHLKSNLKNVRKIEVVDILYFKTQADYERYLKTL